MDFYVYEYYKKDNDEVFYVGKGTKRRMYELHNRNKYFNAVYAKYDCEVRIYKDELTNEDSCEIERQRIAELKDIGQAYCNFTAGGTGFSTGKLNPIFKRIEDGTAKLFTGKENYRSFTGKRHTEESKRLISENRKGKGARFGEDNPMFGKGFKGKDNPMYGRSEDKHPNSSMYKVLYSDGTTERLGAKQCELKFGVAFERIRGVGGVLHYRQKTNKSIYEGTVLELERVTTSREA
jgi:hypothetical protein